MAQMASERGKELRCFLHITIKVGPSLMKKMGKCMQNVLHKAILRDIKNNIQMHLLQVLCKYAEWIRRNQLRLAWLSKFIVP
jgi:hypothetical protein